jgi:hypothetical protein
VSVESARGDSDERNEAWLRVAPPHATPSWSPIDLVVDGAARRFEWAAYGASWVAVGQVEGVGVTVVARNVDVAEVRLVRMSAAELPAFRRLVPPALRARTFHEVPNAPSPENVDLTYRDRQAIIGRVAGRRLDFRAELPFSAASGHGDLNSETISAAWNIKDDPVTLAGRIGQREVSLEGRFRQEDSGFFDRADVLGRDGTDAVWARLERANGGMSSSTLYAEGAIADAGFALWATVGGDLRVAVVHGLVDGQPVDVRATHAGSSLQITGSYSGPDVLLLLIVGTLAYFM